MSRNARMHSASGCHIQESFRIATVPALSMWWVMEYRGNGSVDGCGVMALSRIAPSELPPSTLCFPLTLVVLLPKGVPLEQGACLGIPGITAHRPDGQAGQHKLRPHQGSGRKVR